MKYYEFDYKNKLQKALWNSSNIFGIGILYTYLGFGITVQFNKFLSTTTAGIIMLAASCVIGLVITIYNFCKMKGVFLFDDYIEISSVYTKKTIIPISEITDIKEIEKYRYRQYHIDFKGGSRTDIIQIDFKNIGRATFKIKNQDEFLEELHKKINDNK